MKKKIVLINPECFLQHVLPVITELNKYYHLKWIPVFEDERTISIDYIENFCNKNNINYTILRKSKYRYRNPLSIIQYIKIIKQINSFEPDVIYFEFLGEPYLHLLTKLLLNTSKVIIAIHDVENHKGINNRFIKNVCLFYISKFFSNFHFFSETQKNIFITKYPAKNYFVGRLFLKDFGPLPDLKKNDYEINFLFFGSIRKNKGLEYLIKAGNKLAKQYDNFKITIAGKCEEFEYYNSLIENHEVFNINIFFIPNQKIPEFYAKADYLILPYKDVTQSGPLFIAYNYNVPVIASDLPGFREYIENNKTGFLFKTENSESLANCMENVLEMDINEHKQIKSNLETFVKDKISLDSIINKYVRFFDKL